MTRDQMKALLPDGTDDAVVTALLDAMHAEITPFKDTAKRATDELAAKAAEMAEVSKTAATAQEKAQAYEALQARYEKDMAEANARAEQIALSRSLTPSCTAARNALSTTSMLALQESASL